MANQGARHGVDWGRVGPTPASALTSPRGGQTARLNGDEPDVSSRARPRQNSRDRRPESRVVPRYVGALPRSADNPYPELDTLVTPAQDRNRALAREGRGSFEEPLEVVPVRPVGLLPVKIVDAFFQGLPSESVQHIAEAGSARVTEANLVAGTSITITTATVPDKYVWAITDVQFYALCPSCKLEAPLVPLTVEQLTGFLRFELTAGQRQPFRTSNNLVNPYGSSSDPASASTGWPFVSLTPAGVRGVFALYAKSNQPIQVVVKVDVVPRFWISVVGVRFTGFALPEVIWAEFLRRQQTGF